ncbi:flavodoxin family protein [Clostridium sp. 'deep sea']|uniref:flavodoxin family protein n=1 Tax=Clostridium sp. 'deep sea' TaxID=2779445 RepID=UPI0018967D89|nr:NAD(P)H-dependent oxidoreductase [Clostridium sp. 'deep sea']QOR35467.1 flavodoxin family protein [Clostridium sp. 'deep sea']
MNIVVLSGSPRKRDSYSIVKTIETIMSEKSKVTFDYVKIYDYNIKECTGCMKCFNSGEQYCPLKDDVKLLATKLVKADGIIFASPVYAISISATMKKVIDRLAYIFHRPELIAKPAISVVTTFGGGLKPTQKYLKMVAKGWGCTYIGDVSVMSPIYFDNSKFYNEKYATKINKKLSDITNKFYQHIAQQIKPQPTFYDLYMFQGFKSKTYISKADYKFWLDRNWLNSNFYYSVKLNPIKKIFASSLNMIIKIAYKKIYSQIS